MVLGVLEALGCSDMTLGAVSKSPSLIGVGISDVPTIHRYLRKKFGYVNTHLHREPKLDLCKVTDDYRGVAQFVICSDVLEHVPPPVEKAVSGLRSLVASGGVAVIIVPHVEEGMTEELYPGLVEYEVREGRVYWQDANGRTHCDETPEFHGGSEPALAYRIWALSDLEEKLKRPGFRRVERMYPDPSRGVSAVSEVLLATK